MPSVLDMSYLVASNIIFVICALALLASGFTLLFAIRYGLKERAQRVELETQNLDLQRQLAQPTSVADSSRSQFSRDDDAGKWESERYETLGLLAASVAHDLNNQLTVIISSNSLVSMLNKDLPQDSLDALNASNDAAGVSASLVRQVLGFARQKSGQQLATSVGEWFRGSGELLQCAVGQRINFQIDVRDSETSIFVDKFLLLAVLLSLLFDSKNAIVKSEERNSFEGVIELAVQKLVVRNGIELEWAELPSQEYVEFLVRDNRMNREGTAASADSHPVSVRDFCNRVGGGVKFEQDDAACTVRFVLPVHRW